MSLAEIRRHHLEIVLIRAVIALNCYTCFPMRKSKVRDIKTLHNLKGMPPTWSGTLVVNAEDSEPVTGRWRWALNHMHGAIPVSYKDM